MIKDACTLIRISWILWLIFFLVVPRSSRYLSFRVIISPQKEISLATSFAPEFLKFAIALYACVRSCRLALKTGRSCIVTTLSLRQRFGFAN